MGRNLGLDINDAITSESELFADLAIRWESKDGYALG
jgi:hypothetical protein